MEKKWSELTTQQLGQIGEYYAKMEFISYGYEIYTPDIDDHGVDFIAKDKVGWRTPNALLVNREYGLGKKSKPEWGDKLFQKESGVTETIYK